MDNQRVSQLRPEPEKSGQYEVVESRMIVVFAMVRRVINPERLVGIMGLGYIGLPVLTLTSKF